jgi:hypothetical protein
MPQSIRTLLLNCLAWFIPPHALDAATGQWCSAEAACLSPDAQTAWVCGDGLPDADTRDERIVWHGQVWQVATAEETVASAGAAVASVSVDVGDLGGSCGPPTAALRCNVRRWPRLSQKVQMNPPGPGSAFLASWVASPVQRSRSGHERNAIRSFEAW